MHFTSTDGEALLPADSTLTNGAGNFSATLQNAGGQNITATDTVTASIVGNSASVEVSPGPPTHFSVFAPTSIRVGTAFNVTVTAHATPRIILPTATPGPCISRAATRKAALPADSTLTGWYGNLPGETAQPPAAKASQLPTR